MLTNACTLFCGLGGGEATEETGEAATGEGETTAKRGRGERETAAERSRREGETVTKRSRGAAQAGLYCHTCACTCTYSNIIIQENHCEGWLSPGGHSSDGKH